MIFKSILYYIYLQKSHRKEFGAFNSNFGETRFGASELDKTYRVNSFNVDIIYYDGIHKYEMST